MLSFPVNLEPLETKIRDLSSDDKEIFVTAGMVLMYCQIAEHTIADSLRTAFKTDISDPVPEPETCEYEVSLGRLIEDYLRRRVCLSADFYAMLDFYCEQRNALAHKILRLQDRLLAQKSFFGDDDVSDLKKTLKGLYEMSTIISWVFSAAIFRWYEINGINGYLDMMNRYHRDGKLTPDMPTIAGIIKVHFVPRLKLWFCDPNLFTTARTPTPDYPEMMWWKAEKKRRKRGEPSMTWSEYQRQGKEEDRQAGNQRHGQGGIPSDAL
jgi:hypothetical protein